MLSQEQQRQALLLVEDALDQPTEARQRWVAEQCGGNAELETRVLTLLAADEQSADALLTGHFVASQATPIPDRVGHYRIIDQLGAGGMGVVYRGERDDGTFKRTVAIKFIHEVGVGPQVVARFHSERQILAAMQHPNIAQMLDGGDVDGRPYLVMEYIEGTPFTYRSDLSRIDQLQRFCQVCDALSYAHSKLVLHRDIKASNILIGADGKPKLLDFGIAKISSELTSADPGLTGILGMPVTPNYCPPEYLAGETATIAGEIYSLGVLLHELLFGRVPHDVTGLSLPEAFQRVTTDTGALASCGDKDLDIILGKALHIDPQRRYLSADALRQDVENFVSNRPISARKDELGYTVRQFVRRNTAAVAAGLVSVVLLASAAVATSFAYVESEASRVVAQEQTKTAEKTLEFFLTAMVAADPVAGISKNPTIEDALSFAESSLENDFADEPTVLAVTQTAMAAIYSGQGKTKKSLQYADLASARLDSGLADLDYWQTRIHQRLSRVYSTASRYSEAIQHARTLDDLLRQADDPNWGFIATNLGTLGIALAADGQDAAAIEAYQEVLQLNTTQGSTFPPSIVAQAQNGLAATYHQRGDLKLAEKHIASASEIMEDAGLGDTVNGLRTKNNWASMLTALGEFERAEAIFQQTLPKLKELVQVSHPMFLRDVTNYARTYQLAGQPEKTIEVLEPYLPVVAEDGAADQATTAFLIGKLGHSMCDSTRASDGLVLAKRNLNITTAILPNGHASIGEAQALIGFCLLKLKRFDEAQAALVTGQQIYTKALGADHYAVKHTQQWLDELQAERNDHQPRLNTND